MRRALLRFANAFLAIVAIAIAPEAAMAAGTSDAAHRRGICGEMTKIDLLLYDSPRGHAPTTTCSYTDDRRLIMPRSTLPEERMKRFVFLAFVVAGKLRNDDSPQPARIIDAGRRIDSCFLLPESSRCLT